MISVLSRSVLMVAVTVLVQAGATIPIRRRLAVEPPNHILQADSAMQSKIAQSYGKLPISFEANQGQADAQVKFLSRGAGYSLFLMADEAVFAFRGNVERDAKSVARALSRPGSVAPTANTVLRMRLLHGNPAAKVTGEGILPGKSNYFIGKNTRNWHSNVPTYSKVKYEGIYPGVDLVYYGNQRQLEYDFVVSPGADPTTIQFDFPGNKEKIKQAEDGDLVLRLGEQEFRWHKPVAYQEKDGTKRKICAHYIIKDSHRVELAVASYDPKNSLFIDPLVYSTYLGGSAGGDEGLGIAVDSSGNAYVTGVTASTGFPTVNPLQAAGGGETDAFVAKINPAGSVLVYATYLGGSLAGC